MVVDRKEIPFCPVMSAGCDIDKVCTQDRCAWYLASARKCAAYIIGYNSLVEANSKQLPKKRI